MATEPNNFFDGIPDEFEQAAALPERSDEEIYLDQLASLREKTTRDLIGLRAYWKGEVEDRERVLKAVQVSATPDKWPGSNETERSTAREKAFAANVDVTAASAKLNIARHNIDLVDAELDARDAERKAAEFNLRERELYLRHHDQAMREVELTMAVRATLPYRLTDTSVSDQFNQAKSLSI